MIAKKLYFVIKLFEFVRNIVLYIDEVTSFAIGNFYLYDDLKFVLNQDDQKI